MPVEEGEQEEAKEKKGAKDLDDLLRQEREREKLNKIAPSEITVRPTF